MANILVPLVVGAAVNYLSGLLSATHTVTRSESEGTRLDNLNAPSSEFGTAISTFYGKVRVNGCSLIWGMPLKETISESVESTTQRSGGKGGGGSSQTTENVKREYNYAVTGAFMIGEEVTSIDEIWLSGKKIDFDDSIERHLGTSTQNPSPTIAAIESNAPAYRNRSYIVLVEYPCAKFGSNGFPKVDVVVTGKFGTNPKVKDVIKDVCLKSGLLESQVDVTAIPDSYTIIGARLKNDGTAYKTLLDDLTRLFFLITREPDGILYFLPQEQTAIAATIDTAVLNARTEGTALGDFYSHITLSETELPSQIEIEFTNQQKDYDNGIARVRNPIRADDNNLSLKSEVVSQDNIMSEIASKMMKKLEEQKQKYEKMSLLPAWDGLRIGDYINFDNGNFTSLLQLVKKTTGINYLIELECSLLKVKPGELTTTNTYWIYGSYIDSTHLTEGLETIYYNVNWITNYLSYYEGATQGIETRLGTITDTYLEWYYYIGNDNFVFGGNNTSFVIPPEIYYNPWVICYIKGTVSGTLQTLISHHFLNYGEWEMNIGDTLTCNFYLTETNSTWRTMDAIPVIDIDNLTIRVSSDNRWYISSDVGNCLIGKISKDRYDSNYTGTLLNDNWSLYSSSSNTFTITKSNLSGETSLNTGYYDPSVDTYFDNSEFYTPQEIPTNPDISQPVNPTLTNDLILMDIPLVKDIDAEVGIYLAINNNTYTKGATYASYDGGTTYSYLAPVLSNSAVGQVATALPNASGLDTTNTITVVMSSGEVVPATQSQFDNNQSLLLLGSEIIGFRDATLVATNTYEISYLSRGLRSTDSYTGTHGTNERLVILTDYIIDVVGSEANIGKTIRFKFVPNGGTEPGTKNYSSITVIGNRIKPLKVSTITGKRDSAGNIRLQWTGNIRGAGKYTTGETTQQYLVSYDGTVYTQNVNYPETVISTTKQTELYGNTVTSIAVTIQKVSSIVGNGFSRTQTVVTTLDAQSSFDDNYIVGLGQNVVFPLTTKGDLFTYSTKNTRLPVGTTNYQFLTVDSAQPTGLKWQTTRTFRTQASLPYTLVVGDYLNRIEIATTTTLSIPDASTTFWTGWECEMTVSGLNQVITFLPANAATLYFSGGSSYNKLSIRYGVVHICHIGSNIWHIVGALTDV